MGALIRVMLVDDDSFVRTTLSKMLDAAEGLSVVMRFTPDRGGISYKE